MSQAEELHVIDADTLFSGGRAQPQSSSRFALLSDGLAGHTPSPVAVNGASTVKVTLAGCAQA